ncbi:CinA family protein [Agaribacterium haliotis]|uniref:CinA family protein n=1 Tax=Agaribacterium haliotis TaxID=2013869 RepID=UPI000BB52F08|nr:CinA family protein [Agaribacterium haliotis]
MNSDIYNLSLELGQCLQRGHRQFTCAESCTGGLIAAAVTDVPGSSAWFEQGFVTYSNQAKHDLLGVDTGLFERHGAVSEAVVEAMLRGALMRSGADIGLAVSGIAGPGGGSEQKPVGTVCFAWGSLKQPKVQRCLFDGDRAEVRRQATEFGLRAVLAFISSTTV